MSEAVRATLPLVRTLRLSLWLASAAAYSVKQITLNVTSFDGVYLQARVGLPQGAGEGVTFPAIVMTNSWAVPDIEYYGMQEKWGAAGYVVFEYEARGWFGSGGVVGLGSEADLKDMAHCINVLQENAAPWHVDMTRIASAGISYGAGLAVLGAAYDQRIKAAVSLSGWGNLTTALFHGNAPHRVWAQILLISGKLLGKTPPILGTMWHNLETATNIAETVAWADIRSPENYLAQLAARKVPLFLSNNFEDRLFAPDAALEYRERAHAAGIPTYMMLNQGIHAQAEAAGALGLPDVVCGRVLEWLDSRLKGLPTGLAEGTLDFELRPNGVFSSDERVSFSSWPPAELQSARYALSGRGGGHSGGLLAGQDAPSGQDTIRFGKLSGLSAGVPVISETLQTLTRLPILASLPLIRTTYGAVYLTAELAADTTVCGTPNVTVSATPSDASFQLVAYLYSVEPITETGTLISHAGNDVWRTATPGTMQLVRMRLRSLCTKVKKGHRLGLGIDMYTEMLTPASTSSELSVGINYGLPAGSYLELPLLQSSPLVEELS